MKTISDQGIKLLLKSSRADKPTLISLFYRYNNTRFVYSTGLTIDPYLEISQALTSGFRSRLITHRF